STSPCVSAVPRSVDLPSSLTNRPLALFRTELGGSLFGLRRVTPAATPFRFGAAPLTRYKQTPRFLCLRFRPEDSMCEYGRWIPTWSATCAIQGYFEAA